MIAFQLHLKEMRHSWKAIFFCEWSEWDKADR